MFDELSSRDPKVKYAAAIAILKCSEEKPQDLYEHRSFFEDLMESPNSVLQWTAIDVVGNLSSFDAEGALARNTDRLIAFTRAGKMITANHAVAALAKFARAYPDRRRAVTLALMDVENCRYDTAECLNIVLGRVINARDAYLDVCPEAERAVEFAKRHTANFAQRDGE